MMTSKTPINEILLSLLDSLKVISGLSKNDLYNCQNLLISFLKQKQELKYFRKVLFNLLLKFKWTADKLEILDEHDKYYESMSLIISYYIELEIEALNDAVCEESNMDVFNRIYAFMKFYLNNSEPNIVKAFVHYFIRDNNDTSIKEDLILKDLFCKLFEKLFLSPHRKNSPKGNELDFFAYLFIFKLWHYICSSNEEKQRIEQLIPLLYKFDTSLSTFVISKKYITHTYYDNGSHIIKNIKERILKLLKTDDGANELAERPGKLFIKQSFGIHCPYTVPISWLPNTPKISEDILIESSGESDISSQNTLPIALTVSDASTIRVLSPENSHLTITNNASDISTIYVSSNPLSSNSIKENISSVSTLQLFYSEFDKARPEDISDGTTLSVLNLESFMRESLESQDSSQNGRITASVSDGSTIFLNHQNTNESIKTEHAKSSQNNGAIRRTSTIETISTTSNSASTSSGERHKPPQMGNRASLIRIIERKDYIKNGSSRRDSFSEFRNECLDSKNRTSKRNSKYMENGWLEVKQCSVKVKRLDDLEIQALKNKSLPLEYFARTYSQGHTSISEEQNSDHSLDLNDSNISIEILEETLGSRAYLYCREVQKTLDEETKRVRKRAKSCFNC